MSKSWLVSILRSGLLWLFFRSALLEAINLCPLESAVALGKILVNKMFDIYKENVFAAADVGLFAPSSLITIITYYPPTQDCWILADYPYSLIEPIYREYDLQVPQYIALNATLSDTNILTMDYIVELIVGETEIAKMAMKITLIAPPDTPCQFRCINQHWIDVRCIGMDYNINWLPIRPARVWPSDSVDDPSWPLSDTDYPCNINCWANSTSSSYSSSSGPPSNNTSGNTTHSSSSDSGNHSNHTSHSSSSDSGNHSNHTSHSSDSSSSHSSHHSNHTSSGNSTHSSSHSSSSSDSSESHKNSTSSSSGGTVDPSSSSNGTSSSAGPGRSSSSSSSSSSNGPGGSSSSSTSSSSSSSSHGPGGSSSSSSDEPGHSSSSNGSSSDSSSSSSSSSSTSHHTTRIHPFYWGKPRRRNRYRGDLWYPLGVPYRPLRKPASNPNLVRDDRGRWFKLDEDNMIVEEVFDEELEQEDLYTWNSIDLIEGDEGEPEESINSTSGESTSYWTLREPIQHEEKENLPHDRLLVAVDFDKHGIIDLALPVKANQSKWIGVADLQEELKEIRRLIGASLMPTNQAFTTFKSAGIKDSTEMLIRYLEAYAATEKSNGQNQREYGFLTPAQLGLGSTDIFKDGTVWL